MPGSSTTTCSRCGHSSSHRSKPYVAARPDLVPLVPLRVLYDLLVALLGPRLETCSWCHARRTPRAQASYSFDPFLYALRHSRNGVSLRRSAASLRPDPSSGRWRPDERKTVLAYLARRDGGRCGLCAMPLPGGSGQIDHVIPKKFGLFDLAKGYARPGTTFESGLHHIDNLQAVHDYCNRSKGNTPAAENWRHPALHLLPVASATDGSRRYLWVPMPDRDRGAPAPDMYTGVITSAEPPGDAPVGSAPGGERHRPPRASLSSQWRGVIVGGSMVAAGLVALFVLMAVIGGSGDDGVPAGQDEVAIPAAPVNPGPEGEPPPPDRAPGSPPVPALADVPDADGTAPPAPTAATAPAARPEILLPEPPDGWAPTVDGNASSFGEPDRDDLQWVAWQPVCPECEKGATLTWVGSYAHPVNRLGPLLSRPKLQTTCRHRVHSGPLIDWNRDIGDDRIEALWVDGEPVAPGSWWIGGSERDLMVPEPEPFLDLIKDARELRVLTAGGHDATFAVAGFLTTPVQANLDHCGHYP